MKCEKFIIDKNSLIIFTGYTRFESNYNKIKLNCFLFNLFLNCFILLNY